MPPDPDHLKQLLSRVEGAGGSDREIDALIGLVTRHDWPNTTAEHIGDGIIRDRAGPYAAKPVTASVDAALALVDRLVAPVHPGWTHNSKSIFDNHGSFHWFEVTWPSHEIQGRGRTLALAICAVAVRIAMERADG